MTNNSKAATTKDAELTSVSDKKGIEVLLCLPPWFNDSKKYKISNAPARTAALEFDGADLNFVARVLYAEASGSQQLKDPDARAKEKAAIMNVNHFRLNRKGYPNNTYVAKTFRAVCKAPGQFESVYEGKEKFAGTEQVRAEKLSKVECIDFCEALAAVKLFLATGPDDSYQFDNFRGFAPNGQGTHIGRSRFWLSPTGGRMLAKEP
jgi:hypothetical protein